VKKFFTLAFVFVIYTTAWAQTQYVTTIYPFKLILQSIVRDCREVHCLLPPGASPHTYEVRPSDMRMVETAKAMFIGGKNLDEWALKFYNPNRIQLLDLLPPDSLLYFKSHTHAGKNDLGVDNHDHGQEVDPHFWTDPLTVKALLPSLTDTLCSLDKNKCDADNQNSKQLARHLDSLYTRIDSTLAPVRGTAVLLSHPFFRYFFKRFGIRLVGIIEIAPGKEPPPKRIRDFIQIIKREKVKAIFINSQLSDRPAQLIAEVTGVKVRALDPIGGAAHGQTYDEILLHNVQVILEALR